MRGYVLLADPTPLSAAQLANLRNWFGDSVFDKSAITSGLVVDQNTNYVQIMVGGVEVADNGDLILNDDITDADEAESMESDSMSSDDLLTADDMPKTDDLALEDFGESDGDLSALLEGLEQNEDLSEINDLLEKSDQGVSVDDDMLAMLESVPEGGNSENSDEAFDFFSGEEAVEGEPENIRELTQEELEEREENRGAKKERGREDR